MIIYLVLVFFSNVEINQKNSEIYYFFWLLLYIDLKIFTKNKSLFLYFYDTCLNSYGMPGVSLILDADFLMYSC